MARAVGPQPLCCLAALSCTNARPGRAEGSKCGGRQAAGARSRNERDTLLLAGNLVGARLRASYDRSGGSVSRDGEGSQAPTPAAEGKKRRMVEERAVGGVGEGTVCEVEVAGMHEGVHGTVRLAVGPAGAQMLEDTHGDHGVVITRASAEGTQDTLAATWAIPSLGVPAHFSDKTRPAEEDRLRAAFDDRAGHLVALHGMLAEDSAYECAVREEEAQSSLQVHAAQLAATRARIEAGPSFLYDDELDSDGDDDQVSFLQRY